MMRSMTATVTPEASWPMLATLETSSVKRLKIFSRASRQPSTRRWREDTSTYLRFPGTFSDLDNVLAS